MPLALCATALLALWAVTIWRLGGMWSALPEYSYGWSVPLLCLMMLWERWRTWPGQRTEDRGQRTDGSDPLSALRSPTSPAKAGRSVLRRPSSGLSRSSLFLLLAALLLFIAARLALEVIPNWRIAAWILALSVITITLLLLRMLLAGSEAQSAERKAQSTGSKAQSAERRVQEVASPLALRPSRPALRASHFAFPILFFLLAVPWPSRFEIPFIQTLTQLNAGVTVELLSFLKVAAVRMGNIILIEPGLVGVQEACSGIRSFQSTLMVALFLGELFRFTWWRRIAFVLLGAFFSFLFNIVRTSFLVLECNRNGLGAVDKFHDPAGWTVFAASFVALALIGWLLFRGQKQKSRNTETLKSDKGQRSEMLKSGNTETLKSGVSACQPVSISDSESVSVSAFQRFSIFPLLLLTALFATELGINWWFGTFKRPATVAGDWVAAFPAPSSPPAEGSGVGAASSPVSSQSSADSGQRTADSGQTSVLRPPSSGFTPLTIAREVQAMLQYNRGGGWSWQGGGGERWQSFLFEWDKPESIPEQMVIAGQALSHQPEICFTRAGMEVRKIYGKKQYVANGVPLVFKVYEFSDRNIPIFVFSCTWERSAGALSTVEEMVAGDASSARGLREAVLRYQRGERGITDEVRVLKFGVWGPRNIGEAEVAFQQQLSLLIRPKSESAAN